MRLVLFRSTLAPEAMRVRLAWWPTSNGRLTATTSWGLPQMCRPLSPPPKLMSTQTRSRAVARQTGVQPSNVNAFMASLASGDTCPAIHSRWQSHPHGSTPVESVSAATERRVRDPAEMHPPQAGPVCRDDRVTTQTRRQFVSVDELRFPGSESPAQVIPAARSAGCCSAEKQTTCCDGSEKSACCGSAATTPGGCGCQ
jgi:hypothetical protein